MARPVSAYAAALVDETGKLTLISGPENIPGFDSVEPERD
jgi:hypothetical protein